MSCTPSFATPPGHPGHIANTLTCGVNPYVPLAYLEKCCSGPVRNVTADAPPNAGANRDDLFCIAYCPVKYNVTDETGYSPELETFVKCLDDMAGLNVGVECGHVDLPPDDKSFIVKPSKNDTASSSSSSSSSPSSSASMSPSASPKSSDNGSDDGDNDDNDKDDNDNDDNDNEEDDKDGDKKDAKKDKESSALRVSVSQVVVGACLFALFL